MKEHAFYPQHIVGQIKKFFSGVHDMTDFYYKLYLLNGLCQSCDGRGYTDVPERRCPDCGASGETSRWSRPRPAEGDGSDTVS